MQAGQLISAASSGEAYSGGDAVNKLLDNLKDYMIPSVIEGREAGASKAKRILSGETKPLKIKVMANDNKNSGKVNIGGGRKRT